MAKAWTCPALDHCTTFYVSPSPVATPASGGRSVAEPAGCVALVRVRGAGDATEPIPFDLDGNLRFVDDPYRLDLGVGPPPIVDMGCYEFQLTVYPTDFDSDWDVDGDDFTVLASCMGGPGADYLPGCVAVDLDGNSDVDMEEFSWLQQQFTGL